DFTKCSVLFKLFFNLIFQFSFVGSVFKYTAKTGPSKLRISLLICSKLIFINIPLSKLDSFLHYKYIKNSEYLLVLYKIKMIISFKLTINFYIPFKHLLMTIHVAKTIVTTAMRPKTRFFVVKLIIIDINPSAYKLNASE